MAMDTFIKKIQSLPPDKAAVFRGSQFTADSVRRWLKRIQVQQRFGAIGKPGSIAVIEHFWKTLKNLLGLPLRPPLLRSELDNRLDAVITYYDEQKPHHALGGATPSERFHHEMTRPLTNLPPPRARPGQRTRAVPFQIRHWRGKPNLPYLVAA